MAEDLDTTIGRQTRQVDRQAGGRCPRGARRRGERAEEEWRRFA